MLLLHWIWIINPSHLFFSFTFIMPAFSVSRLLLLLSCIFLATHLLYYSSSWVAFMHVYATEEEPEAVSDRRGIYIMAFLHSCYDNEAQCLQKCKDKYPQYDFTPKTSCYSNYQCKCYYIPKDGDAGDDDDQSTTPTDWNCTKDQLLWS